MTCSVPPFLPLKNTNDSRFVKTGEWNLVKFRQSRYNDPEIPENNLKI